MKHDKKSSVDESDKDYKRLNWLSHRMGEVSMDIWAQIGLGNYADLREAIDNAIECERA